MQYHKHVCVKYLCLGYTLRLKHAKKVLSMTIHVHGYGFDYLFVIGIGDTVTRIFTSSKYFLKRLPEVGSKPGGLSN
jgi:hypothetical protein